MLRTVPETLPISFPEKEKQAVLNCYAAGK